MLFRFLHLQYIPQIFRSLRLALILCKVKNIRHIFNVSIKVSCCLHVHCTYCNSEGKKPGKTVTSSHTCQRSSMNPMLGIYF